VRADHQNRPITGIVSLALGVIVFSVQDAIIKKLSGDYSVTQTVFVRCVVAIPILAAMVHYEVGFRALASRYTWPLIWRGAVLLVAYTTYFMAIAALPLAEVVALFFTAPVLVTLMSRPMLGEKVTLHSWIAVGVGFIGTLIILRPGSALFEPASLLALLSAATYAFAMVLARRMGATEAATVMSFYQNGVYTVGAVVIALGFTVSGITSLPHPSLDFLVRPWAPATLFDFSLMAACGVIAAFGATLLAHAYKSASATLVTVFEYTGMIWVPLWGFLFFQEVPSVTTAVGIVLIVGAGLYAALMAKRNNRLAR
jgi:drug/metabolite transporter (DMT)-like permease